MLGAHSNSVAIASNTSVLVAAVLAGCLTLEHLAVLRNTMALALGNAVLAIQRLALGRGPSKVVTADLNVVVCKLAELIIVHTQKLSLLRSAQVQAGDLVNDEGEDCADNEGVRGDSNDVSDLLVNGIGRAGDGASGQAVVDTVETDNVVRAENTVDEESPHSSDTVLSEDIEGIVDADPELDCKQLAIVPKCREVETYSW